MIKSNTSVEALKMGHICTLPRGGYVVETSQGLLQVGSPPETIKDSILFINDVPRIFCIGEPYFSFHKGINVAELEFPIYFNFFIKKQKTIIVANQKTCQIFEKIIKLILFGDTPLHIKEDYNPESQLAIPDIKKEISFFVNYSFQDIVDFVPLNDDNLCVLDQVQIEYHDRYFSVTDQGLKNKCVWEIPELHYSSFYQKSDEIPATFFHPPAYGMTCLGASHGFDPHDNTSGFIFWANQAGILVDPPANSTDILHQAGINPRSLKSMILTHIHADHDSGFFQKVLEQDRITVYTTQTVMDMWLKKYSLITSLPTREIKKLFDFVPVSIDRPIEIEGVEFTFRYMIHSIPTIGFTMKMSDKTITFSSDHLNEPIFFKELLDNKYIVKERYDELMNFPWESDIIYHEAGIPPLHTPVTYLDSLPPDIKRKIFLYHISKSNVPTKSSQDPKLVRCESGVKHTTIYETKKETSQERQHLAKIFSLSLLSKKIGLSLDQCRKLFEEILIKTVHLDSEDILSEDPTSEDIYMVISGALALEPHSKPPGKNPKAIVPDYQIITNYHPETTHHHLRALVPTQLAKINKKQLFQQTHSPQFNESLDNGIGLDMNAWEALSANALFEHLTLTQRVDFINFLEVIEVHEGQKSCGLSKSGLYLYHSGTIMENKKELEIQKGDGWGNLSGVKGFPVKQSEAPSKEPIALELKHGRVYHLSHVNAEFFLAENPGLTFRCGAHSMIS